MKGSKIVPLIYYEDGKRVVVGEVQLSENGQHFEMHGVVTNLDMMAKLMMHEHGMYSIVADAAVPKDDNDN